MKRLIIFLLLFAAIKVAGQTTGYLRFDTVKIMKQNGTCELYLINSTKDSLGVLTNVGGGLTRFIKSRVLNDSVLIVGVDTMTIVGSSHWELNGSNNLVPKTFGGNQVQINNKSFLITGATGAIPTTSTGTHFYWYPAKWALRAGQAFTDEWSDTNIGDYSFAFGEATKATGFASIAIGSVAQATATAAVALGGSVTASGQASIAIGGTGNHAAAAGSFATNTDNIAFASSGAVFGFGNRTNTTTIPQFSIGRFNDTTNAGELFRIGWITDGGALTTNNIFSVDTLGRTKIGKLDTGDTDDSVMVWDAADSLLKKVAQSSISGGVDLDTSRNATSATIISSGTDAVIPLANVSANKAGLLSPAQAAHIDSLMQGLLVDTTIVAPVGDEGEIIGYPSITHDTLFLKRMANSRYISFITQADSSITTTFDTAQLRDDMNIPTEGGAGTVEGGSFTTNNIPYATGATTIATDADGPIYNATTNTFRTDSLNARRAKLDSIFIGNPGPSLVSAMRMTVTSPSFNIAQFIREDAASSCIIIGGASLAGRWRVSTGVDNRFAIANNSTANTIFNIFNSAPSNVLNIYNNGAVSIRKASASFGFDVSATTAINKDSIPLVTSITNEHILIEDTTTNQVKRIAASAIGGGGSTYIYQFVSTQQITVSNTTAETTIYGTGQGSAGIDGTANITTGTQVILKGAGTIGTDGAVAGEPTFAFKFPTSTVSIAVTGLANGLTGSTYTYEFKAIPLGTGTSQDYIWFFEIFVENNGTPVIIKVTGRETGVLTTTGTLTMDVTVDWNTADADNTLIANYNTVEIIKK